MQKVDVLKKSYSLLIFFLFILIVFTPYLTKGGFLIFTEEFVDGIIIAFLLLIGFAINSFYEREVRQREQVLADAWKHVGAVNLLVDRFRAALTDDKEYPKNKKELQSFAGSMMNKIRGIAPCEFLLLRVVDIETFNTVFEFGDSDLQWSDTLLKIGNKKLVQGKNIKSATFVSSQSDAVRLKTFIIFSEPNISEDGKMVAQKLANDFTMVYIISTYIL
jgi:hypothetical protein